ncbi:Variant-specific surface protein [Giardia duodenalis]|uniref:High cysteine protein n=2 Tax=Giardia intestinalis TaxID=5741 RepID=C6LYT5_GIAIB|nr:High cysteine protein [Giardia intestinalis ATCC 50581]ESU44928.1 Variant-specific surface protein [Giardia intestinalis]
MFLAFIWVITFTLGSEVDVSDASEPYRNAFGDVCRAGQVGSCVSNKCINIGRYAHVCTECQGNKVPINGACSNGSGDSYNPDSSMCKKVTKGGSSYCIGCNEGSSSAGTFFLFYGGCYNTAEFPGSHVCSVAAGGVCTSCNAENRFIFINKDATAPEKCILCSDTIGFSGNQGVEGCAICSEGSWKYAPFQSAGIQCTVCFSKDRAPIDGSCKAFDSHNCSDGYCKYCYKTHIYHNGGCYDRTQQYSASICSPDNQFVLGNYAGCKECVNTDEVPREGNCKHVLKVDNCSKDSAKGKCLDCRKSNPGTTTFLYLGGCYHTNEPMGMQVCSSASNGLCTQCAISGCTQCDLQSSVIQCSDCGSNYLSLDNSMCLQSCPSPSQQASSTSPNKCECSAGYSLNTASMTCYLISNCPDSVSGCSSCDDKGQCTACLYSAYNIQPDRQSCALGCPDGFTGAAGELCHCPDGYFLQGDVCVAPSNKAGLAVGAVTAIVVVVLVILAVVGILCWFFLRKKRLSKGKATQSLENLGLMTIAETI